MTERSNRSRLSRTLFREQASPVSAPPEALTHVLARVRRRRRAKRIVAGSVALALSAGSLAWLSTSFGPDDDASRSVATGSEPPISGSPAATDPPSVAGPSSTEIIGLTVEGDVVAVDRVMGIVGEPLARFPGAIDVEVAPSGEILVVSCCEPAAGAIHVLDAAGGERVVQHGLGVDIRTSGESAVAEIDGLRLLSSVTFDESTFIPVGAVLDAPEWPAWALDGEEVIYTAGGRLYSVSVHARSLDEALELRNVGGGSWYSPVQTADGIAAIRSEDPWTSVEGVPPGPSSLVLIGRSEESTILYESSNGISSLAVSDDGTRLLWVDDGMLMWNDRDGVHEMPTEEDLVAAVWSAPA
jgi:hypothetical protein